MTPDAPHACLVIIGNEILSGRTQDANLAYIARGLGA
jgi:molybdopterin-biosynthesis enzyme MoeA-like protein